MGVYQMFGRGGGIPNGGIMKPPPGAPAAWMPYALVKDAKAAAATAAANGGKIVNGPMEVPGGDWIAQGMDPQGAMFSVHSLKPAAQSRHLRQGYGGQAGGQKAAPARKAAPAKKATKAKKAPKKSCEKGEASRRRRSREARKPARKKAPRRKPRRKPKKKAAKRKK